MSLLTAHLRSAVIGGGQTSQKKTMTAVYLQDFPLEFTLGRFGVLVNENNRSLTCGSFRSYPRPT